MTDKETNEHNKSALLAEWEKACQGSESQPEAPAILMQSLIPASKLLFEKNKRMSTFGESRQSVLSDRAAVYWDRLFNEAVLDAEHRDQQVLTTILKAADDGDLEPICRGIAASRDFAELALFFGDRLEVALLQAIAGTTMALHLENLGSHASWNAPGLTEIWDTIHKRKRPPNHEEWIASEVVKAVPRSLRLAMEFESYWLGESSVNVRREIRNTAFAEIRAQVSARGISALIQSLDRTYPYSISRLLFPKDLDQAPWKRFSSPKDRQWLANILLKAADVAPDIVIPQIALLIERRTRRRTIPESTEYEIDSTFLAAAFGSKKLQALQAITNPIDIHPDLPNATRQRLTMASRIARQELNSRAS